MGVSAPADSIFDWREVGAQVIVYKINFNLGDSLFCRGGNRFSYRGRLADWPIWCAQFLARHQVTDLVLFGDCRPLHKLAIAAAARASIRVMVAEEGYLRPDWITFEPYGVNGHSNLPRDPGWYRREAAGLSVGASMPVNDSFARRALEDVLYNGAAVLGGMTYPFYRTHRPWHPALEYAGWLRRLARLAIGRIWHEHQVGSGATDQKPYFLFPLQLACDFQLRVHSPFADQSVAITRVVNSFARWAPSECMLVVKQHPLENGLRNWRALLAGVAERAGVSERVVFIEDDELPALAAGASGMVTINSTSGMVALERGVPVFTLGTAIYDVPGLTSGGSLDDFWVAPRRPDASLFHAFKSVLIARCMVPGGFYSDAGLNLAVAGAVARLERPPAIIDPTPFAARPVQHRDAAMANA
jgi:capsular polysaccharide export protein